MKNKLGIFTALILSLIIAGSAFAAPAGAVSAKKTAVVKAKIEKTTKKAKKHRKRKTVKKAATKMTTTPKKSK